MIKKILKSIIFVGPTILPMELLLNGINTSSIFGLLALIVCIYFLLSIWKESLFLKIPLFFRGMATAIACFVWFSFLWINVLILAFFRPSECGGCADPHQPVARNGEQLDLNKSVVLKKTKDEVIWMDCSCGKIFSYENNGEYALSQIRKMGDYWQHLPDCSSNTLYDYAEQTSFDLNGECYLHKEDIRDDADITLIYNVRTKKLLYLFYSS